jgi:hypothetical protein
MRQRDRQIVAQPLVPVKPRAEGAPEPRPECRRLFGPHDRAA